MTYSVKEIYYTLQGEGAQTGRPAVFCRFAGCNLWSGRDEDRENDAERNDVACPLWCDTDFRGGQRLTADAIAQQIQETLTVARVQTDRWLVEQITPPPPPLV